jgi:hypothetical protein
LTTTFQAIPWPRIFTDIKARLAVINMEIIQVGGVVCLYPWVTFYDELLTMTIGPLVLMAILVVLTHVFMAIRFVVDALKFFDC